MWKDVVALLRFPVAGLAVFSLVGCGEAPKESDGLFLLAADAVDPEVYDGRQRVVNPFLIAEGNPPIPSRVLESLQEAGFEVMAGSSQEDPAKATFYFSAPAPLPEGGYEIRLHISLGERLGTMHRKATWWRVFGMCADSCEVTEIYETDNSSWH
jgi:hypothetical protein